MAKLAKSKKASAKNGKPSNGASAKAANKKKAVDLDEEMTSSEEDEAKENGTKNGTKNGGKSETKSILLSECQKLFETTDLYTIFEVEKSTATTNDIKKAYYKLSLRYHPDKVSGDETAKKESTHKFQVLGKIYTVLGDEEKRKLYDESGIIDGEDDASIFSSDIKDWEEYWRMLFKKISKDDVEDFFKNYKDSAEERAELLQLYEKHKGDMDAIVDGMFSQNSVEDEPRFRQIIVDAIEKGDAKKYAKFTNESKNKASKRKAYYEKEAKEAEEMRKELGVDESQESLRKTILSKRQAQTETFLDQLASKYGGDGKKNGKKAAVAASKYAEESSDQENESEAESEQEEDYNPKKKKSAVKKTITKAKNTKKATKKV